MAGRTTKTLVGCRRRPLVAALVVAGISAVAVLAVVITTPQTARPGSTASAHGRDAAQAISSAFAVLSAADTDVCQDMSDLPAIERYVGALPAAAHMQGSCCSAMDLHHYAMQFDALKHYAAIAAIPPDPYDISKTQSEELLGFYNNIHLDQAQQEIFAAAQAQTSDHGWCCCQCWAWYTHAGLAKYLITASGFDATRTARVIDLEDCCGG